MNPDLINKIGSAINSSYGLSSIVDDTGKQEDQNIHASVYCNYSEASVKCQLRTAVVPGKDSDTNLELVVKYTTIAHFADEQSFQEQKERHAQQSVQIIDNKIKEIRDCCREEGISGLKIDLVDTDDSIEMISMSPHTPRHTAYYRRNAVYSIG